MPVYKACYDLLIEIFQFTKEFSKEYNYTVGESIKKETIELLTLIYRANVKRDKNEVLQEARDQLHLPCGQLKNATHGVSPCYESLITSTSFPFPIYIVGFPPKSETLPVTAMRFPFKNAIGS